MLQKDCSGRYPLRTEASCNYCEELIRWVWKEATSSLLFKEQEEKGRIGYYEKEDSLYNDKSNFPKDDRFAFLNLSFNNTHFSLIVMYSL